jgi:crotonobetainyl-CoA:carnitine CoA-transferase CaiB-like acyl-CoA transferase
VRDLLVDPHMRAREAIPTVDDPELGPLRMHGVLPSLSRTPGSIRSTGPRLGAHNADVYSGLLGLDGEELDALRAEGVV